MTHKKKSVAWQPTHLGCCASALTVMVEEEKGGGGGKGGRGQEKEKEGEARGPPKMQF